MVREIEYTAKEKKAINMGFADLENLCIRKSLNRKLEEALKIVRKEWPYYHSKALILDRFQWGLFNNHRVDGIAAMDTGLIIAYVLGLNFSEKPDPYEILTEDMQRAIIAHDEAHKRHLEAA